MSSIITNPERVGSFTSSEIYHLMTKGNGEWTMKNVGAPFKSYVAKKRIELRLGRSFDTGAYSKPMAWGTMMEHYLNDNGLLGIEYSMTSNDTDIHPTIKHWSGTKDFIVAGVKTSEVKAYQPQKFCAYADCLMLKSVDLLKKHFAQEYWQLLSNAIINGLDKAEAVLFMPYQKDLADIRGYVENLDFASKGLEMWEFRYICEVLDENLPYIPDDNKHYKDLTKFEFEVPTEDKELLTGRVKMAAELLNK